MHEKVQRYSSTLSQGFEDEDLGNSPVWWAATVATYSARFAGDQSESSVFKSGFLKDAI